MYKLIACDLDDTLLGCDKAVSLQNLKAVRAAMQKGVKFVPATGRGYITFQNTLSELGLNNLENEYSISFNGAIITENKGNRHLYSEGVSYETVKKLFDFGMGHDVCIHVYTARSVYIYRNNNGEREYLKGRIVEYIEPDEPDITFLENAKLIKVMYQSTDTAYLESIKKKIDAELDLPLSISLSANRYLEFNASGVDKGSAAIRLGDMLGISREEIVGIGDNLNDLALISKVGLGVSVQNGKLELKEKADYVTKATNDQSAVAEVIHEFII